MAPFTVFFSPGFHLPKTFHVFGLDLSVDVVDVLFLAFIAVSGGCFSEASLPLNPLIVCVSHLPTLLVFVPPRNSHPQVLMMRHRLS